MAFPIAVTRGPKIMRSNGIRNVFKTSYVGFVNVLEIYHDVFHLENRGDFQHVLRSEIKDIDDTSNEHYKEWLITAEV